MSERGVVVVRRIYDWVDPDDGYRVLVDRLWPRGLSKEKAAVDHWLKTIAPSETLRKGIHADKSRWNEFIARYRGELKANPAPLEELRALLAAHPKVTLLYASTDDEHNNAIALLKIVEEG